MRLFVAVRPDVEVIDRIVSAVPGLRAMAPSAKWVKPDSLHITLAFLGERAAADVPAIAEALSRAAARHAPFEIACRGGGAFGGASRPRTLWAGCEGDLPALDALCKAVAAALEPCGYVPDRRDFNAHLTLARARDRGGDHPLAACAEALQSADFGSSRMEEVTLYESRLSPAGAVYTAVHRAPLASAR